MAIVAADWTITRSTGAIRYIGDDHGGASPSYATVIELHRWIGDLSDDATSTGDDEHSITDPGASDRLGIDNIIKLLGIYNIDANASEHLYDGSIIQGTGGTEEIYDGIVNFGNADVQIQIAQDGAVLADDWWNFSGGGLNPDSTQGISHRFMLPVRTAGADIDLRRILGTARRYGFGYSEFFINGTSRGNNVLALKDATDLNNGTASGTVATWTGITNTEGYRPIDVNNDTVDEYYYSEWNKDIYTINQLTERMKYLTRDGSAETMYGLSAELFRGITHDIVISTPTGTFVEPESLSWGTGATAGTGQLLAIDSTTAGTVMYIQHLTGVVPSTNTITGNGGATALAGTVTAHTIPTPFFGISTGSAIVGSYGLGIEAADLAATDKVTDLSGTQITPPNNVTFTVFGTVAGDRLLVTNNNAGAPDEAQLSNNALINGATVTAIVTSTAIPTDTPSTGTIRVERASGNYTNHAYTSYTGSTFTIGSTDFSTDTIPATNNIYIAYVDEAVSGTSKAFTVVYVADRTFFVRLRDGGVTPIKEAETTGILGANGGSATVNRISDE